MDSTLFDLQGDESMKINLVLAERIMTLTEVRTRFEKIKSFVSNWKHVAWLSVGLFTMKIAAEQIIMLIVRGGR